MNGKYIVGIDGSIAGQHALDWALRRAALRPAPVLLVHVGPWPLEAPIDLPGLLERARTAYPDLAVDAIEVPGPVATAFASLTTPEDLLVIGTHQHAFPRTPIERCGSREIVSACACSVVVVPQADVHLRSGVVVGIDHHESGARLASVAAAEAALRGEDLFIIQSVPPEHSGRRGGLAVEDAIAAAHESTPTVITSLVTQQRPAQALVHGAHVRALLVIGESTTPGMGAGVQSVLHEVLTSIPVPVLVVRGIGDSAPRGPLAIEQLVG